MSIPAQEARQAPPWGHRRSDGPASSMGTPDRSQPALLVGPSSDPGRRTSHDSAGSSGRREAGRTPNGALRGQGTPFGPLAKNPKRTTLTREQLLKMVTDCYQLSKHNKLDKRNMWNLTLIDCMPQLVRDQCEEDGTFNFATVTCGLDASVEIYAKRVDCTHSMAMDTLTMSKNRGQSTVQRGDEETGGEGDTQAPRRGRAKPVDATSTLLPEETGGEREITTEVPRDPLFRVTAAKFDAAGQEGLFLVQMGPTNGVEDSMHLPVASRIPVYPVPTNCHWGTHEEEGWSTQRPQTCAGVKPTCSRFCELLEVPAIDHGYIFQVVEEAGDTTVCNGSDHRMPLLQTPLTSVSLHGWGKESHSVNLGTSVLEGGSDHDGDFEVMVHGDGVDAGEVDRGDVAGFHLPWHGTPLSPQPVEEILDKNGLMWVLEARFGRLPPTRKIASHWKFPQQQCGEASKQKKRQPRRRKDKPDYTCLPEIDCSSLAPAKRFNRIDLLTRRPAHKLIQEDPYYEEPFASGLFLRPNDRSGGLPCGLPGEAGGNLLQGSPQGAGLDDFNDDGEGVGISGPDYDWDDGGDGVDEHDDLIAAPGRTVAFAPIRVAARMKHVDIGALKAHLWQELCQQSDNPGTSSQTGSAFSEIVRSVPEAGQAGRLEDISPHMCFICLLHLANEHGLQLSGSEMLDEVLVDNIPENSRSGRMKC